MASRGSGVNLPLRLAILSPVDPRRARTNAVADVRLCAALASHGHEVQWIVPSVGPVRELSREEIWRIHGVTYPFDIRFVRTPRESGRGDLAQIVPLMASQVRRMLLKSRHDFSISRDLRLLLPLLASARRFQAVPWLHEYRDEIWERRACRRASRVLATNSEIVKDLRLRIPNVSAFITGNPILEERAIFSKETTKAAARRALDIDSSHPLIVYTGKLYSGMAEAEHLFYAASRIPTCQFLLTGGQASAIQTLQADLARREITNVTLTGFFEQPERTRLYQQAADILVSYYSVRDHPYAHHNLPNKLAEYMSTGNPVVVADFPAVRDLATASTAVLVKPDAPTALVEALKEVLGDPRRAAGRGVRAQRLVHDHPFERVAEELGTFLHHSHSGSVKEQ